MSIAAYQVSEAMRRERAQRLLPTDTEVDARRQFVQSAERQRAAAHTNDLDTAWACYQDMQRLYRQINRMQAP